MSIDNKTLKADVASFEQKLPRSLEAPRSLTEIKSLQEALAKITKACDRNYPIGSPYSVAETFRSEYENLNKIKNKPPEVQAFCNEFKEAYARLRNSDPLKPVVGMKVVYANVRLATAPVGDNNTIDFTEMATAVMTTNNQKIEVFTDLSQALSPHGKALPTDTSLCRMYVPANSIHQEGKQLYLTESAKVSATQLHSVIHREPVGHAPALTQPLTNPAFNEKNLALSKQNANMQQQPSLHSSKGG